MIDPLTDDLGRLEGILDGSRMPGALTDAERLRLAAIEARLIRRRLTVGAYRTRRTLPRIVPAERN